MGEVWQFNTDFLDKIDTEQKAYIIGLLQCDGSFSCKTKDSKSYYRYKIALQERDRNVLENIMTYLNHTGKLTVQKRSGNRQNLWELSFNSRSFVEKLAETLGGYKKAERTKVPKMDAKLLPHYIRGVFDADGSFGDWDGMLFRIDGKKPFLENVCKIIGADTSRVVAGHRTFVLRLCGSDAVAAVRFIYSDLTEGSLFIDRKYTKAVAILENRSIELKGVG